MRSRAKGFDLALFAVKHVAHGLAASLVHFCVVGAVIARAGLVNVFFRLAATGAAVGEAGLAWPQLEFFSTGNACLNWKWHGNSLVLFDVVPVISFRSTADFSRLV
jgi:hypothetical protein